MNLLQRRSGSSVWERPGRIPTGDTDLALKASARDGRIVPDPLDEASEESFPASDAPARTPVTGRLDGVPHTSLTTGRIEWALHERLRQHAILWACGAGSALIAVYLIVLALANSLEHATTEFLRLKYWMTALVLGFGLQVGLFAYARAATHGHAIHARGVAASGSSFTFDIKADTHSGDLAELDLTRVVRLEANGETYRPVRASTLRGHHATGSVTFEIARVPERFTLAIATVRNMGEIRFDWP